jgi:hypothetical protein
LWKALITLAGDLDGRSAAVNRQVIDDVLADAASAR